MPESNSGIKAITKLTNEIVESNEKEETNFKILTLQLGSEILYPESRSTSADYNRKSRAKCS